MPASVPGTSGRVKFLLAKCMFLEDTTTDTDNLSIQLLIGAIKVDNLTLIPSKFGNYSTHQN